MCKTIVVNASECDDGGELSLALSMPLASIPRTPSYADGALDGECCLCWVDVPKLAALLADRYTVEQSQYDPMEYTFTRKQEACDG